MPVVTRLAYLMRIKIMSDIDEQEVLRKRQEQFDRYKRLSVEAESKTTDQLPVKLTLVNAMMVIFALSSVIGVVITHYLTLTNTITSNTDRVQKIETAHTVHVKMANDDFLRHNNLKLRVEKMSKYNVMVDSLWCSKYPDSCISVHTPHRDGGVSQ